MTGRTGRETSKSRHRATGESGFSLQAEDVEKPAAGPNGPGRRLPPGVLQATWRERVKM